MFTIGVLERSGGGHTIPSRALAPTLSFLYPQRCLKGSRRRFLAAPEASNRPRDQNTCFDQALKKSFITSLDQASRCCQHRTTRLQNSQWRVQTSRNGTTASTTLQKRGYKQLSSARAPAEAVAVDSSTDDARGFFDSYPVAREQEEEWSPPIFIEPQKTESVGNASLQVDLLEKGPERRHAPPDDILEHSDTVDQLADLLGKLESSHEEIYETYQRLPAPRVIYLPPHIIQELMRRLAIVKPRTEKRAMRYLSIMDDMKAAKISMKSLNWNAAVAFAGLCMQKVDVPQVQAALSTWKEMELEAGVRSTENTFTILFHIATRARKFVLADMILKEMALRRLPYHRNLRTTIIYFHGLQGDSDGVRRAYRDFIEAGEFVDTVVMNCAVQSFIRAGEPSTAEAIFERMKRAAADAGAPHPSRDWRSNLEFGYVLRLAASLLRDNVDGRKEFQSLCPITPDQDTYRIMIHYHALDVGDRKRVKRLLKEMQVLSIPLSATIWNALFRAFENHGGVQYSAWTPHSLKATWQIFKDACIARSEESPEMRLEITPGLAHHILAAYQKCTTKQETLAAWKELRELWKPSEHQRTVIDAQLTEYGLEWRRYR